MKKNWWKILGVLLLVYVLVFSLIVPLSPGIDSIYPKSLKTGDNTIKLSGYNTSFLSDKGSLSIFVEYGTGDSIKTIACSNDVTIIDNHQISFNLKIPESVPSSSLNLRVSSTQYNLFANDIVKAFNTDIEKKDDYNSCSIPAYKYEKELSFPNRLQLNETIRNLMFHVPMWFTMMLLLLISFVYSIRYLRGFNIKNDIIANQAVNAGLIFAFLGIITGAIWAKFSWSEHTELFSFSGWWANDAKLNGAAISTLIYIAYRILRNSLEDEHQKAKISAVYNIFAFVLMLVFIMVLPRVVDSLHPGNGGNPAFSKYDLDSALRMVFYPAVIGWFLIGCWILSIKIRLNIVENKLLDQD